MAHEALASGGLAVGSALEASDGTIVAGRRNRAYDPGGGTERLQGSPLAHAEMYVLAAVPTNRPLNADTLWSSIAPCSMCEAAIAFTGVGAVRWLAPDPSASDARTATPRYGDQVRRVAPEDDRWLVVSSALFLASIVFKRGGDYPMLTRHAELEPEIAWVLVRLVEIRPARTSTLGLARTLSALWDSIVEAARARRTRLERET